MRVLICPDKFAGTLAAADVAASVADGWRSAVPDDELICRPLADGGPGFLEVLRPAVGGTRVDVSTLDPLGRPARGWVLVAGQVAYVESAQACGLHLLTESERDPMRTTSYGLGLLLTAAVEAGAREVVVGLGGSATNDAGAGMLAALGAPPLNPAGYALPYGGAALTEAASLGGVPRLRQASLVAATDVDNPLLGPHGASAGFGPQKGAGRHEVALLEAALARFAEVLERDLPGCPLGLAWLPGGGAAGGIGAALQALGGQVTSGVELVARLTGLADALDAADLVITGEGSFDHQSLRGKVAGWVAREARARRLPCVVVAGRVRLDRRAATAAGVRHAYSLVDHFDGDLKRALAEPADGLRELGRMLATRG